jgi:hypothetical protein
MTRLFWLPLSAWLLGVNLLAGTIEFQLTNLGDNEYRYTYFVSGIAFGQNEALDISFNPFLYESLSDGVADNHFSVVLLQPNNPPGTNGDYIALARVDNPSLKVPFSVDFTFLGSGTPGAQPFLIDKFDANFNLLSTSDPGDTTAVSRAVPEPAGVLLPGLALLIIVISALHSRRPGISG